MNHFSGWLQNSEECTTCSCLQTLVTRSYVAPLCCGHFNSVISGTPVFSISVSQPPVRFEMNPEVATDRQTAMKAYLLQLLENTCRTPLDGMLLNPERLPKRELPPGKVTDLYHLYEARCTATCRPQASIRSFRRVWHDSWKQCLKFRHRSQHAVG